jgi:hypothetical protein
LGTIFVLDSGAIGIIINKKLFLNDLSELCLLVAAIIIWVFLLLSLRYVNRIIDKFVEQLNNI